MITAFLHQGYLLKELNEARITLIPEKKNPTKINDYRTFSLYNVSSKFISKLLANGFRKFLPKIISPLQSAFVPNRDIHEIFSNSHKKG